MEPFVLYEIYFIYFVDGVLHLLHSWKSSSKNAAKNNSLTPVELIQKDPSCMACDRRA